MGVRPRFENQRRLHARIVQDSTLFATFVHETGGRAPKSCVRVFFMRWLADIQLLNGIRFDDRFCLISMSKFHRSSKLGLLAPTEWLIILQRTICDRPRALIRKAAKKHDEPA